MSTAVVNSPRELVAVVPHILGFQPTASLVVLALDGTKMDGCMRIDASADLFTQREHLRASVATFMRQTTGKRALVVLYADDTLTEDLTAPMRDLLATFDVHDVITATVREGRVSIDGDDTTDLPTDCPAIATMIGNGSAVMPSREELDALLSPRGDWPAVADALAASTAPSVTDGIAAWAGVLGTAPVADLAPEVIATAVRAAHSIEYRDALLARIIGEKVEGIPTWAVEAAGATVTKRPESGAVRGRFVALIQRIPEASAAEALSMLGLVAWAHGNGTLASLAAERALKVDPSYSLATLVRRLCLLGARRR